jgi:peptidoglycan hydrolase CwlO-like protein
MLTKNDVKEIGKVVDRKTEKQTDALVAEMKLVRMRVQGDIQRLGDQIEGLEEKVDSLDKRVRVIEKVARKTQKDIDVVITTFDRECLQLEARTKRVENYLELPATN